MFRISRHGKEEEVFQTPAPRGGVPLDHRSLHRSRSFCFKPLRLGAVFLCAAHRRRLHRLGHVSNPCASGRCSSAEVVATSCTSGCHVSNPCASGRCSSAPEARMAPETWPPVSNPCASGRCSSVARLRDAGALVSKFQTPAPRGGVPLKGECYDYDP